MSYPVSWWLRRSRTEDYQKAYDRVAEKVDVDSDKILVDVQCGEGEMLRRIATGKLIGTDFSMKMLERARENLSLHGISSRIINSPVSKRRLKEMLSDCRVLLFNDNCLDSRLPSNFFNFALTLFPDFSPNSYAVGFGVRDSREKRLKMSLGLELKKNTEIHRILTRKGLCLQARYYEKSGPITALRLRELLRPFKVKMDKLFETIGNELVLSDSIGMDANVSLRNSKHYIPGNLGYRVLTLKKNI